VFRDRFIRRVGAWLPALVVLRRSIKPATRLSSFSIMVAIIAGRDAESGFRGDGKCYSQRPCAGTARGRLKAGAGRNYRRAESPSEIGGW